MKLIPEKYSSINSDTWMKFREQVGVGIIEFTTPYWDDTFYRLYMLPLITTLQRGVGDAARRP